MRREAAADRFLNSQFSFLNSQPMTQDTLQRMQCSNCKNVTYFTTKNRKTIERKLEFKKYCRFCRGHKVHKEGKRK